MTSRAAEKLVEALESLGFTRVEAEIYLCLLRASPATGYGIAQSLGKAVGNVYKAIESLETKGAVVTTFDESENRLCRPVPVDELLDGHRKRTDDQCAFLRAHLPAPGGDPSDDRVYRVSEREQFLQRCRRMLRSTQSFALMTLCPALVDQFHDEVSQLVRRGRIVGVKVFSPVEWSGAIVILDPRGESAVRTGPGQWCFLTVDGREFIQGLFDAEGGALLQGAWSESALMTWAFYTGLSSDLVLAAVRAALLRGDRLEEVNSLQERLRVLESPQSSGKRYLIERHRGAKRK